MKTARGRAAHLSGLAAEEAVARRYEALGAEIAARRWRADEGEIDLIVREPGALVFVEVKAGAGAAFRDRVTARQWARLEAAAERYMVEHPTGASLVRFDVAFVGPGGAVEVVENARSFDAW